MDLTHKDVEDILKIIDSSEHLDEIELVLGTFRLHVVRNNGGGAAASRPMRASAPSAAPAALEKAAASAPMSRAPAPEAAIPEGTVAIRAPMLGTFYRAPAPNEKPFVEVGQKVHADDTVCMIEVMKLFNSIRAGVDGVVTAILVENGGMVEFNQIMIHVAPSG